MSNKKTLEDLLAITETLRGEKGCPWDKEQTRESIKPYLIEEAYEVLEAIDLKDPEKIREELGDLLFQVIFHARLSEERGEFGIYDVIGSICSKLVRRHPHVFEDKKISGSREVKKQWEEIKRSEKKDVGAKKVLHGVPKELPGLVRAQRLQEKAASVGFDWDDPNPILAKIREEMEEILLALNQGDASRIKDEIGDLLFAVVNLSRYMGVHAEEAIRGSIQRFIARFEYIEEKVHASGRDLKTVSLAEMDRYWDEAKKKEM